MIEVRRRKNIKEDSKATPPTKLKNQSWATMPNSIAYAIIFAAIFYVFSPYRIKIVRSKPPIYDFFDDDTAEKKLEDLIRIDFKVPEFIPVDFKPKKPAEEKSFTLYKNIRTVSPADVIINKNKVPWNEFDIPGYINKGRIKKAADAYKAGGFNQLVSDDVNMDRDIPDTRLGECPYEEYEEDLPTTSVIITYHNELRSTLLRTIVSVIRRTPARILKEIIIVDDGSSDPSIGEALTQIEQVKLVINRRREGLIRSRIRATMVATGQTLTFLDSHVEVNEGWIEPLMERIKQNPKLVVAPIIDVINKDNFDYIGADAHLTGGVSWSMVFRWDWMTNVEYRIMDHRHGIKTPTIAGGLFAVSKEWFHEIGEYDDQMDIWGGENIEFSFRVWQCGGEMEILPCSRVGHVFRDDHPYDFGSKGANNVFVRNNNRFVHTWMDEYKDFYYGTRPNARTIPVGDLSVRLFFREKLQCKPFDWYMKNVYVRQHMPERNSISWGHAKRGQYCLQRFNKNHVNFLGSGNCNQGLWNPNWQDMDLQSFVLKADSNLFQQPVKQSNGSYRNLCWGAEKLDADVGQLITLTECATDVDSHQRWVYHGTTLRLQDSPHLCMDATKLGQFRLQLCNDSDNQNILFEMLNI